MCVILTKFWDGCEDFKANCPLVGPGPIESVPSVEVFLRDPSPYLHEFWEKPQILGGKCELRNILVIFYLTKDT